MGWLLSLGVSLFTGIVTLVASGFVADVATKWFNVNEREGGRGYAVVFLALLGFVAGCVIGLIVARIVAAGGRGGGWRALGLSLGTVSVILGLILGLSWLQTDHPPYLDGRTVDLLVEIRLPAGEERPTEESLRGTLLQLYTSERESNGVTLGPEGLRREGDRWIVPSRLLIFNRGTGRSLGISRPNAPEVRGPVKLPAWPTRADEKWSEWWVADRATEKDARVPPDYRYAIAVNVPTIEPDDEAAPKVAAAEKARFDALDGRAPIVEWLAFTRSANPGLRGIAVRIASERLPELVDVILGDDPESSAKALHAVACFKKADPLLAAPIHEIGRRLRTDLERFNALPADDEAAVRLARAIETRFADWHPAVVRLHLDNVLDGRAEFQPVHDLARGRADHRVTTAVADVTAYFLAEWAEIPKPSPTVR